VRSPSHKAIMPQGGFFTNMCPQRRNLRQGDEQGVFPRQNAFCHSLIHLRSWHCLYRRRDHGNTMFRLSKSDRFSEKNPMFLRDVIFQSIQAERRRLGPPLLGRSEDSQVVDDSGQKPQVVTAWAVCDGTATNWADQVYVIDPDNHHFYKAQRRRKCGGRNKTDTRPSRNDSPFPLLC
jgi:hypothetical protein